ncbi:MAG: ribose-phosphate pyrophosphokinase [Clostridiales bacterium]|nr:ribose-phosphate pyrophosphokinase [Clostridiales bacterium]
MNGCEKILESVDNYLVEWRNNAYANSILGAKALNQVISSFQVHVSCPRFGTGEGKGLIKESVRGKDLFIICDPFNYGVTYNMYGMTVPMSPDDHFQDLKRIISAIGGKAKRVNVIMPMLYEGRQHRRSSRESLDCAMALQELVSMGVENIITFDAHDSRVQNAVPLESFESVPTSYQMIKSLVKMFPDVKIDSKHAMIISPDEGGMSRALNYSSVLGLDVGMFYKRRDYSVIVNGRNPIVCHEFLGDNVEGKDVFVVDDMISSGDSVIDIAAQLKKLKAKRIFIFSSFGLFCEGLEKMDKAYEDGLFDAIFTTNLIYVSPELKSRDWHMTVDMSKYLAYIIDTLNYDNTLSPLLNPVQRIKKLIKKHEESQA